MSNDSDRRVKRVPLYHEYLNDLLRGEATVIDSLPDDATVQRCYDDPVRDYHALIVQSDTFEPVEEGEEIPIIEPNVVTNYELKDLIHTWRQKYIRTREGHMNATIYKECADDLRGVLTGEDS